MEEVRFMKEAGTQKFFFPLGAVLLFKKKVYERQWKV